MIVLDTNVVSELMRPQPKAAVLAWVDAQAAQQLWLCSVVAAELFYGLARLPAGARKRQLATAMQIVVLDEFAMRVLAFDLDAASVYASLVVKREQQGRPVSAADAQIAAICLAQGATLATRNTRDFSDMNLRLIDPFL